MPTHSTKLSYFVSAVHTNFFQLHKQFFRDDHKIVSVDVYAEKPEFYQIDRCKTHKSMPVSVACQNCAQLYSARCPSEECSEGLNQHS